MFLCVCCVSRWALSFDSLSRIVMMRDEKSAIANFNISRSFVQ